MAALAAGKHVLCEARMAMNAAEGRRMLEASRKAPNLVAQLVPAPHTLETDPTLMTLLVEEASWATWWRSSFRPGRGSSWIRRRRSTGGRTSRSPGHNILNMGIWYEAMSPLAGAREASHRLHARDRAQEKGRRRQDARREGARSRRHPHRARQRRHRAPALQRGDRAGPAARGVDLRHRGDDSPRGGRQATVGRAQGRERAEGDPDPEGEARSAGGWRRSSSTPSAGEEKITHTTFEDGVRYMEFTDAVTKSAASGQAVDVKPL